VVAETNARLVARAPALEKQHKTLRRQRDRLNAEAGKLLRNWSDLRGSEAQGLLREQLEEVAQRRTDLERRPAVVRAALRDVGQVYAHLKPYEQRELMRLVVHKAEGGDEEIVLEVNGSLAYAGTGKQKSVLNSSARFQSPDWLPKPGESPNFFPNFNSSLPSAPHLRSPLVTRSHSHKNGSASWILADALHGRILRVTLGSPAPA
jgi:hypothetical protein